MLTPFQRVCAVMLGMSPATASAEDVDQYMRQEVIRHDMEAGLFRFNKVLLNAYHTGDAETFAAAAGIEVPPAPEDITLLTINAKLDLILRKLS